MPGKLENDHGMIIIPEDVIANMAGNAAMQCYGVVGMASRNKADGFASLLRKEMLSKGVKVIVDEKQHIVITLHIIVEYGVNIAEMSKNIAKNVKYHVEMMTGFVVKNIEVYVESIRVDE